MWCSPLSTSPATSALAWLLASTLSLSACGSDDAKGDGSASTSTSPSEGGESSGSGESETSGGPTDPDYSEAGPFIVANRRFELPADDADRVRPVELWYPSSAAAAEASGALEDFVVDPAYAGTFAGLVAEAPDGCTRKSTSSAAGAPALEAPEGGFPLVLFSHCHACSRYSTFSIAERLASHGFAVAAVDHVDNTLLDQLDGDVVDVSGDFLLTRGDDMRELLDVMLGDAAPLPSDLQGIFDPQRVGIYGHSYGAATAGLVLQEDPRVLAGVAIAAPIQSPLIPGVSVEAIDEPMLFLLAREDNSITEIGNNLLRDNFTSLPAPAWLVEVQDAGHWSFSDLCGLIDLFAPGCGDDMRQTNPSESFTYLDNEIARDIGADYVTAFFALHLLGDESARESLDEAHASGATSVSSHD